MACRIVLRGVSLLLLAQALPGPAVRAQVDDASCLPPVPGSLPPAPLTGASGRADVTADPTTLGFRVSDQGRLCRIFSADGPAPSRFQVATERSPGPGRAFLLSSLVPGGGQWYLGQGRWPAYLALEAWAWIQFLDWRREGRELQREYKDLAWLVARRVSTGRRTDAGWEYYEALTQFQASGAFDTDPLTDGIQPESDPSTFNGSIWVLAQQIFLPEDPENPVDPESPAFDRAFDYYRSRAYAPSLAWDWGSNTLHQEEYGHLIREADEALRSATGMVGIILANHLLSAVDALVSARLGLASNSEPVIQAFLVPGPFAERQVTVMVRLPLPFDHVR